MGEKENVLTKTYDLLLYAIPQLERFPRSQRFLLGDRIQNGMLNVLELLIEAYYGKSGEKQVLLERVNLALEKLRFLVRLSHEFHYLNHQKYGQLSERINEIGRMVGGWKKSLK